MDILYLGESKEGTTSKHRALALRRLGHNVNIKNPYKLISNSIAPKIFTYVNYHTGYRLLQPWVLNWLEETLAKVGLMDIIWVNGGELFGKKCMQYLQEKTDCPIILYNNDDPTGGRNDHRFDSLLKAIPYYDLCVVMREQNVQEFLDIGANSVKRVWMSYDEVAHKPFDSLNDVPQEYRSEVAFIGTRMRGENRDKFMLSLAEKGIPISIWGKRWNRSPYWKQLKPYYKGGPLSGRNYVAAIQGAKICIGLLSSFNRDEHTTRSLEIPYAGGLLCAERTKEHLELYEEGNHAVFWNDVDECIRKCEKLLDNEEKIKKIKKAGMKRVRNLEVGNESVCRKIINEITGIYIK